MYIGKNIKYLRVSAKLTQAEFGKPLDRTRTSVSMWESGTVTPELEIIVKISELYNIKIDDLVFTDLANKTNLTDVETGSTPHAIDIDFLSRIFEYQSNFPAVCITDLDKKVVYVNHEFTKQTGFALKEIKGKRPSEYMQQSGLPIGNKAELKHKLQTETEFYSEIEPNFTKSGKLVICRIHFIRLSNGFISFAIFERKEEKG